MGTTFEERDEMIATEPETYYITDHYLNYPWVLVRLAKVRPDAMKRFAEGRRAVGGKEQARRHKTTRAVRPKHQSLIKIRTLCKNGKECGIPSVRCSPPRKRVSYFPHEGSISKDCLLAEKGAPRGILRREKEHRA